MNILRRARDSLLIADPGLTGVRTALFGLLGATGAVLLTDLVTTVISSPIPPSGLVLPGVVGAVGSTTVSGGAVTRAWRTCLVVGLAAAVAAFVLAALPASVRSAPLLQVAVLTLVTALAAWSRARGPLAGAAGLAVWLGSAVTIAGVSNAPASVTALGPLLAGGWLAVLAATVLRPRPEVGLRLSVAGLLAAANRSRGQLADRILLLRLALTADAQLARCRRADAPELRVALIRLHAAADANTPDLRARADVVRESILAERMPSSSTLARGASIAQGVLPGLRPAEVATVPDGWGARSRLPSVDDRHTVRVAIAALLAAVVGTLVSPGHLVWAVLTVFTVLSGPAATATSLGRAVSRVAGTAVGVGVGILLDQALSGRPALLVVVAVLGIGFGFWIQSRHYAVAMAAGSVAIAGLYRLLGPDPTPMLALRLTETAIGGLSAIVITAALWPTSAVAVRRTVDEEFRQRRRDLHAALDQGSDPDELAAAVVRQEQAVDAWLAAGPRGRPNESETVAVLDRIAVPRRLV